MPLNTLGIVIREQTIKENDRLISVLTQDSGIIRGSVYGAKKLQSRLGASTQLFAYSDFSFSKRKDYYTVDHAVPKEMFFDLRSDIEGLAMAQYFAQLEEEFASSNEESGEFLRLMLNSLHMICKKSRPLIQIKIIFELRIICLAGYMPDIMMCGDCGKYDDEYMYFNITDGSLKCEKCSDGTAYRIGKGIVHAMRHICYSDHEKIFNFTLSDDGLKCLSEITENYIKIKTGKKFSTLDFYYSII